MLRMDGRAPDEWHIAWDGVTSKALKPDFARQFGQEEVEYLKGMQVYTEVAISECTRVIGKKPIGLR